MERLGWDGSANNICSLDNQQQETESFLVSDLMAFTYSNGRLDSSGLPQKSKTSKRNAQQCQEITKQAAASVPETSGAFSGWSYVSTGEMCSSPILNRTRIMNPLNGLMPDFGIANEAGIANGFQEAKAVVSTATGSLESLDCLLSATNRNADASADDNGISMIFSDCKRLWKIGAMDGASPGESVCIGYSVKDANSHCRGNELDETISQASSDHETKINATKRKNDQILMKAAENCCYLDLVQADSSTTEGGFQLILENQPKPKKARSDKRPSSSNINFQQPSSSVSSMDEPDSEAIAQMKEMIYHAAAFRPVNLGMEVVEKTKRKNVRISNDPQTVAARQRRERISERIRVLQKLVPGGSKMDTASMLDEAANYLKFLRSQVKQLETLGSNIDSMDCSPSTTNLPFSTVSFN